MRPNKILARSLEVNLTSHCNLSCYGCDHASPVNAEEYLSVEELRRDLAALSPVYHVFEFRLTGGEPFLHPELMEVVAAIRGSGIADKITLVTNGVLLHKASEELWKRIDRLVVSIYPGVKRRLSHDDLRDLAHRHGMLLWHKPTDEFTIKLLHSRNGDDDLVKAIYDTCTLKTSCHTLHHGRYFKCSPSPFMPNWLRRVGVGAPVWPGDSVLVRDNPDLHEQLKAFLSCEEPLGACRYCLGCAGRPTESRQMNRATVQEWLSEKDPDVRDLVDWAALGKAQARRGLDINLTGMVRSTLGLKIRWLIALGLMRLLHIDVISRPPTMVGPRVRRLFRRLAARLSQQN